MSKEAAKEFVQLILNDDELAARAEALKPEEAIGIAKEKGYDFTEEELKEILMGEELEEPELEEVAGGLPPHHWDKDIEKPWDKVCKMNPTRVHKWKKARHKEEYHKFLWIDYSYGFDEYTCIYCGKKKWQRVV